MVHSRDSALAEPMLKPDEETRLIKDWQQHQNERSKERIVRAYMRSCYSFAARYTKNETHMRDLAQEGSLGICRALDKFDFSYNVKFSTYCFYWIENFVADAASRTMNVVYVPSRAFLESRMGKLEGEKAHAAFNATNNLVALEATVDETGQTYSEKIADKRPNPEDLMVDSTLQEEYKRLIARAMSGLTPREQKVIFERKLTEPPRTLEDISTDLGVTRERVRQIEIAALQKMAATLSEFDVAANFTS